ncbi:inorganic diphosphatase [Patescibacteria group bacterium]|nr:inorganic diphosphatase [Patescibacteria group bacterium]
MYHDLPIGPKAPKLVNAVIEISKGSHNKYEFDQKYGVIRLDRVLHSPFFYPVDYGYIPETHAADGDHLDIMIYNESVLIPGCLVTARPVGVLLMEDENGEDEKILAVAQKNPLQHHIHNLKDIPPHFLKEVSHFFTEYKRLEIGKHVKVKSWKDVETAYKVISRSYEQYKSNDKIT